MNYANAIYSHSEIGSVEEHVPFFLGKKVTEFGYF